jgi:hypothetical protein
MTDSTQPRMAVGTKLSAGILAAALFALLAFAPLASAAPDPLASGTTTITLKNSVLKGWKKQGVKLLKVSPAKLKGSKATFTVTGGSLDPTTGLGTVNLGGGLKFKAGKKSATVKALILDTSKKKLTAKVAGKKMKTATIKGSSFVRNGFGVNLNVKSLKLTSSAAKQLNKKLGFTAKKSKGKAKGHKRAAASKTSSGPFKANQAIGSASAETQPSTVTILPSGSMTFATAEPTVKKLLDVGVKILPVGATAVLDPTLTKPVYGFPITGGTIAPTGTAGTVQTSGGLNLVQEFPGNVKTEIGLGNFYLDLGAKTVTVEVVAHSNASKELDLGALGRSSIADVSLTGATVTSDPTTHTVSVQNASTTLQPVSAEVLDAFRKVAEGGLVKKLVGEGKTEEEAKTIAAAAFAKDHVVVGDPLGTFSFTAQTQ